MPNRYHSGALEARAGNTGVNVGPVVFRSHFCSEDQTREEGDRRNRGAVKARPAARWARPSALLRRRVTHSDPLQPVYCHRCFSSTLT
jgi:hypothetical protein